MLDEEMFIIDQRFERVAVKPVAIPRRGDAVQGQYRRGRTWYPGIVQSVHTSRGTYVFDILYDDGDSAKFGQKHVAVTVKGSMVNVAKIMSNLANL